MKKQGIYIASISACGFAALCFSAVRAAALFMDAQTRPSMLVYSAVMLVLLGICHMLPIYITSDKTIEISFVPVVASLVTKGVDLTIVLYAFSSLFVLLQDSQTRRHYSPWLRAPLKELFNVGNVLLSIWLAGRVHGWVLGGRAVGVLTWGAVGATVVFSCVAILLNLLFFILYFRLAGQGGIFSLLRESIGGIIPSILATIPLGLVIGMLLARQDGYLWIALFMGPLLLARYSFKIYLDSRSNLIRTIGSLAQAVEAKDSYTLGHSQRVAYISCELCKALGCSKRFTEQVKIAALLHDIGKIGIDDAILRKPGSLTPEEFDAIKQHPIIGKRIIEGIRLPNVVNEAVLYHHRWYNGEGYPEAKPGEGAPPLAASILAVADRYDAMISGRPYRGGMTKQEVRAILRDASGTQVDPRVVAVFLEIEPTLSFDEIETLLRYTA